MRALGKPIVVAVNGPAAGAGVGLALAGDIVIAARSARFILSFVRLGAALDGGTSLFVQAAIGAPRAKAMAMLGESVDASTAERWGLIWKMVDDQDLLREARTLAMRLAEGPPISLALIKRQLETARVASVDDALDAEARAQGRAFQTHDLQEGAAAFREKRPPRFAGR
jgi:enoyl-CoA hydratase/carnithine racemase